MASMVIQIVHYLAIYVLWVELNRSIIYLFVVVLQTTKLLNVNALIILRAICVINVRKEKTVEVMCLTCKNTYSYKNKLILK